MGSPSFWLLCPLDLSSSLVEHTFTFGHYRLSLSTFLAQPWNQRFSKELLREVDSCCAASFPPSRSFIHYNMISTLPSALMLLLLQAVGILGSYVTVYQAPLRPISGPPRRMVKKSRIVSCFSCRCSTQVCVGCERHPTGINGQCLTCPS